MRPTKKCNKLPNATKKWLVIHTALGVTFITLAVICFAVDPVLLVSRYKMKVAPGFQLYDILQKEMVALHISAYLFNVTNAEKFIRGEDHKLRVQEVGPFTYQEIRLNKNFKLDQETEELYYQPYITTKFLPEMSIADPATINISIANTALLAIATSMSSSPFWSRWGLNVLTKKYKSKAILTLPAKDYLWGYHEPLLAFGNTIMPGWINFRQLGLMDRLYDNTRDYRVEISLKEEEKFRVKRINEIGGLPYWGYNDPKERTRCNTFEDTYEGIAYPPSLSPDKPVRLYRDVFCRIFELDYVGNQVVDYGPEAYHYRVSNRTYSMGPDKECLCKRTGCIDGMSDLSPCFYGLSVMLSNAHFYDADPKVYERIEGVNPTEEEHGSSFLIEPKLGTVLSTSLTFQLNVPVADVSFNSAAKPFSNMVVPIAYFKAVQPELKDDLKRTLWIVYVGAHYGVLAIEIALFVVGAVLLAFVIRTLCCNCLIQHSPLAFQTPNSLNCETPLMTEQKEARSVGIILLSQFYP